MFNKFDFFSSLAVLISFLFSNYIWFIEGDRLLGIYVGIWMVSLVGVAIYIKLIRIRRLVLTRLQKDIKEIKKGNQ